MSVSSVRSVMNRIATATAQSPIAVFTSTEPGMLNAVFGDTVETRRQIQRPNVGFVGMFDRSMDVDQVEATLTAHIIHPVDA